MGVKKYRLIPWTIRLLYFFIVSLVVVTGIVFATLQIKKLVLTEAKSGLSYSAGLLIDVARQRHDLIRISQFEKENDLEIRLKERADFLMSLSRQLELASIRKQISVSAAQQIVIRMVSDRNVGENIYAYILSDCGKIIFHPSLPEGFDLSDYGFFREMRRKKSGVIRYDWKNPGDAARLQRVVAYRTIYSWGWLIGVGAVPDDAEDNMEFEQQQLDGFREYIRSLELDWKGIAAVFTEDGHLFAHPLYSKDSADSIPGAHVILTGKSGIHHFTDPDGHLWWCATERFKPRHWIIAVMARNDRILASYYTFRNWMILWCSSLFIVFWIVQALISSRLAMSIRKRVKQSGGNSPTS